MHYNGTNQSESNNEYQIELVRHGNSTLNYGPWGSWSEANAAALEKMKNDDSVKYCIVTRNGLYFDNVGRS